MHDDVLAADLRGRRGGRPALADHLRAKPRQVWATDEDWLTLKLLAALAGMRRGPFMVKAGLGHRIRAIPSPENLSGWQNLGRLSANLNQLARHANGAALAGEAPNLRGLESDIAELRVQVDLLRAELIGIDVREDADDSEDK